MNSEQYINPAEQSRIESDTILTGETSASASGMVSISDEPAPSAPGTAVTVEQPAYAPQPVYIQPQSVQLQPVYAPPRAVRQLPSAYVPQPAQPPCARPQFVGQPQPCAGYCCPMCAQCFAAQPPQLTPVARAVPGRGKAIASMVLGIFALLFSMSYFTVIALAASIIGVALAASAGCDGYKGGMRTAGLVMSIIGLTLSALAVSCVSTMLMCSEYGMGGNYYY